MLEVVEREPVAKVVRSARKPEVDTLQTIDDPARVPLLNRIKPVYAIAAAGPDAPMGKRSKRSDGVTGTKKRRLHVPEWCRVLQDLKLGSFGPDLSAYRTFTTNLLPTAL